MEDLELIDDLTKLPQNDNFLEAIRWWEKKRPLFALLIACSHVAVFIYQTQALRSSDFIPSLLFSLTILLFVNLVYCASWGVEMLLIYYFKWTGFTTDLRMLLFILGSIGTIMLSSLAMLLIE